MGGAMTMKPLAGAECAMSCIQGYQLAAARRTLRECQRAGCSTRSTLALIQRLERAIAERQARQVAAPVLDVF
jgi:hypothetical protein